MQTKELTPAVAHLVNSARTSTTRDLKWELVSYEGRSAADIIREAMQNLDQALTPPANQRALQRRLRELSRKV